MSEKWTANDVVCYGSAGILLTILLYVILAFAPSLMVSISIADTLVGWNEVFRGTVIPNYNGLAFTVWIFSFGILAGLQLALQANIRHTWLIVIVWWLVSIHPFLHWFPWWYSNDNNHDPFPGIDWFPFF